MTVKGRTITQRQHRVGGKLDPDVHGVRFYPTAPVPQEPLPPDSKVAKLPARRGAAERALTLDWYFSKTQGAMQLLILTEGWFDESVHLDERQAKFLRDTLNEWFPDE